MLRTWCGALCAVILAASTSAAQYQLVWQDEFDGTTLDLTKWEPQIGTGCPSLCGWGNNELQYYRSQNATVSGGFLTITAKQEPFGGRNYTSARLRTRNRGDWKFGRIEMRAKMPIGKGLWPAFWMLPTDDSYGVWAASGEIDIMEYLGDQPTKTFGTLHYGGSWPANQFSGNDYFLPSGTFHDDFHVFTLEWDECEMRWYVDGNHYATQQNWWSSGGPYPAPFDDRFHLLLNVAVGGNLPGPPDGTTMFPQEMVVDWVRVYQIPELDVSDCFTLFDGLEHANPLGNGWFTFGGSVGGGSIQPNFSDLPPVDGCDVSLQAGYGSGGTPGFYGGFGRTNRLDLTTATHFTMWINPDPGQSYTLEINLQDDDDGNDTIPGSPDGGDDEFQYNLQVGPPGSEVVAGGGWQRVSIPLASFFDDPTFHFGGNGVFDPTPVGSGGNGRLINVVLTIAGQGSDASFRTDRYGFTRQTSSVAGRVWSDDDGNGNDNGGSESGLAGVDVELFELELGAVIATATTLSDGSYAFPDLMGGEYEVRVDTATLPAGLSQTFDPDGLTSPDLFELPLSCDVAATDQDFGYAPNATSAPLAGLASPLSQNRPNPFSPRTGIEFFLPQAGTVELTIYDVSGRRVTNLVNRNMESGTHRVEWDGRDEAGQPVSSGVYFYRMRTEGGEWIRRMSLLR